MHWYSRNVLKQPRNERCVSTGKVVDMSDNLLKKNEKKKK